jgi:hypothetical protein
MQSKRKAFSKPFQSREVLCFSVEKVALTVAGRSRPKLQSKAKFSRSQSKVLYIGIQSESKPPAIFDKPFALLC